MKPKNKILILICSISFLVFLVLVFNFVNNYLVSSDFYINRHNTDTDGLIISYNAQGIYSDGDEVIDNVKNMNEETYNKYIGPAQQIREMRKNNPPDKVVPLANKQDKEKVIECAKKYLKEEEDQLKNKDFEFDNEFEVILDKNKEGYFYAFFSIYHKTSYCERKESGVIMNVKKNEDNTYEVFDKCIYW